MSLRGISQPHDSLFRHTFGQQEHAVSFFKGNLPPALVAAANWDRLALVSGSFVDEELRHSQSDLLFQAPLQHRESPLLLYLLFEHQSSTDRRMPLRLLEYMARIWRRHLHDYPDAEVLPPILPIVLAQVAGGWNAPLRFQEYLSEPEEPTVRQYLRKHQPQFEYALIDLGQIAFDKLRGDIEVRMVLGLLKAVCERRVSDWLEWTGPLLGKLGTAKSAVEFLSVLFHYLVGAQSDVDFFNCERSCKKLQVPIRPPKPL